MGNTILVIHAHPRPERSVVNTRLRRVAEGIEGVDLVDLYAEYPRYDIDVRQEQARLDMADVVVFQHPVFWYSAPAILKEWIDLVLEYGWAYGARGRALHGKVWLHAVSAGAGEDTYRADGVNGFSLRDFFRPFEQTAALCGMTYLPPLVFYDAADVPERAAQRLDDHAATYARLLKSLRAGALDLTGCEALDDCAALLPPLRKLG